MSSSYNDVKNTNVITLINENILNGIANALKMYPNNRIAMNVMNTRLLSIDVLNKLSRLPNSDRLLIRVVGGYDNWRIEKYTASHYVDMHKHDNIYSLYEMKQIVSRIIAIEKGINSYWSAEQKLFYIINQLRTKIIYHPFFETQPSKDIRSLRGLFSGKTVCAGYAMILKELCDRNGIDCQYVEGHTMSKYGRSEILNHAWNIVRISGNYFPIDLTWNAGDIHFGKTRSIEDLANVNKFIESHFPGKYEKIQDYRSTLKSIDGTDLLFVSNLINKDVDYEVRFSGERNNGEKFIITPVEEFLRDDKYVYKYIYNRIDSKGKVDAPIVFYSSNNISGIMSFVEKRNKLINELDEAIKKHNVKQAEEIKKVLRDYEWLDNIGKTLAGLMLSKKNLEESLKRADHYLGEIQLKRNEKSKIVGVEGLVINPSFGKKINLNQRTLRRRDGTFFVIEEFGSMSILNNTVYRYRIYETILVDGKYNVRKDTIFTDNNIMYDNRFGLADDFLSRSRLDRKKRETGGYLGKYDGTGKFVSKNDLCNAFKYGIYNSYRLADKHVKNYYEDVTFNDLKRLVRLYKKEIRNGKSVVVNRYTGEVLNDSFMATQVEFALLWLETASFGISESTEPIQYFNSAFLNSRKSEAYEILSKYITESLNKSGNIDTVAIYGKIMEEQTNLFVSQIFLKLFSSDEKIKTVLGFYRLQNPSALDNMKKTTIINSSNIPQLLMEKRRLLEFEKRQLLEVVKSSNGEVQIIPYRKP